MPNQPQITDLSTSSELAAQGMTTGAAFSLDSANEPHLSIRITSKAQHEVLVAFAEACGSVKAAARELGVSNSTYSNWMNFRSYPNDYSLGKRPRFYEKLAVTFESVVGVKLRNVFPSISKESLAYLAEAKVARQRVPVRQITAAVEREKLSYTLDMDRSLENNDRLKAIRHAMRFLSYRERRILELRFGIGGDYGMTLEEVGHVFKISRERVRALEAKALRKLQNPGIAKALVEHAQ